MSTAYFDYCLVLSGVILFDYRYCSPYYAYYSIKIDTGRPKFRPYCGNFFSSSSDEESLPLLSLSPTTPAPTLTLDTPPPTIHRITRRRTGSMTAKARREATAKRQISQVVISSASWSRQSLRRAWSTQIRVRKRTRTSAWMSSNNVRLGDYMTQMVKLWLRVRSYIRGTGGFVSTDNAVG